VDAPPTLASGWRYWEQKRELILDLQVEYVHRKALQVRVGRSARHELAPNAPPRSERGDHATRDETPPGLSIPALCRPPRCRRWARAEMARPAP
jgi:hypothetical protein